MARHGWVCAAFIVHSPELPLHPVHQFACRVCGVPLACSALGCLKKKGFLKKKIKALAFLSTTPPPFVACIPTRPRHAPKHDTRPMTSTPAALRGSSRAWESRGACGVLEGDRGRGDQVQG